ncbi:phosphatidate cytidylyltransferase [Candidatus Neomarinimicrobiota bacterium]
MPAINNVKDTIGRRMAVNVVGIPGLLLFIWLGGWPYAALICAVVLLGIREYLALVAKLNLTPRPVPLYLATALLLAVIIQDAGLWEGPFSLYSQGLKFLALAFILAMALQITEILNESANPWMNFAANYVGFIWVAAFGGSFILVRQLEIPSLTMVGDLSFRITSALYVSVWVCDSLAYICGKAWGKAKILPAVSPNKTVVGTISGLVGAVVLMLILGLTGWLPMADINPGHLVVLGLICGGLGQTGDFVQSRFKRDAGVKDSGKLLPGHGGILDRFDSLLYVMPAAYLYLELVILP